MDQRHPYWLEKVELELAAAAALAVGYFLLWPLLKPADPAVAMCFLPEGAWASLLGFALTFWAIAAGCAVLTISARPQAALAAALIGAAGLSVHSPQMRNLFWDHPDTLRSVYASLGLELLLLACIVGLAVPIVVAVRRVAGLTCGRWLWQGPPIGATGKADPYAGMAIGTRGLLWGDLAVISAAGRAALNKVAGSETGAHRKQGAQAMGRAGMCLLLGLVVSVALLFVLLRSPDRGQILFALAGSFLLGGLISHQVLPAPVGGLAWVLPVAVGLVACCLGAASAVGESPQSWTNVQLIARALPMDWISAGGGGAMVGYWISARMHEARFVESQQTEMQGA